MRARNVALTLTLALAAACSVSLSACPAYVDADAPVVLAALDPELLSEAKTFVFGLTETQTCTGLVNLGPADIDALLREENPPIQVLDARFQEHVFGVVKPNVPIAYFILASSLESSDNRAALGDLAGTVFAMGCADFNAPSGTRHDLPITLFPVGLR